MDSTKKIFKKKVFISFNVKQNFGFKEIDVHLKVVLFLQNLETQLLRILKTKGLQKCKEAGK